MYHLFIMVEPKNYKLNLIKSRNWICKYLSLLKQLTRDPLAQKWCRYFVFVALLSCMLSYRMWYWWDNRRNQRPLKCRWCGWTVGSDGVNEVDVVPWSVGDGGTVEVVNGGDTSETDVDVNSVTIVVVSWCLDTTCFF